MESPCVNLGRRGQQEIKNLGEDLKEQLLAFCSLAHGWQCLPRILNLNSHTRFLKDHGLRVMRHS